MPFLGELCALLAASLWAATSMIVAKISAKIGSVQTNISRMIVATVLLISTIILFKLPIDLSSKQVFYLGMSAICGLVFGDSCLFKAFQKVGPRIGMLMMSLAPAIAAILAYTFLDETLSPWGILGILVTLFGISLVVFERTAPIPSQYHISKAGLLLAFFGAFGQGSGLTFAKLAFAEGEIHGIVASCIRIGVALMILLPIGVITGHYRKPVKMVLQDKKILGYLLIISVFGVYLGITLSLVAVAYAKVGIASTLISTSPVIMLPLVRVFHKEELSWKAIIGALIAVGGVAILFLA